MTTGTEEAYRKHHSDRRREGFAVLEKERGELFANIIGKGKKVLDLGCRDGVITKYFSGNNDVTGADIDSVALDNAKNNLNIKTVHFDLNQAEWPLEPSLFDVVVAAEVVEHLYLPDAVLGRINKLLKPGGMLVGSVPNAFSLKCRVRYALANKRGTPLQDPMHINHFSWKEMRWILSKHFKNVELISLGNSHYGLKKIVPSLFSYGIVFKCVK